MELGVGTIDQKDKRSTRKKIVPSLAKGKGAVGNGKNGGGGGDDGNDNNTPFDLAEEQQSGPDKFKILMWFLLLVVLMTFSGLIAAYVVIAANAVVEWKPFSLPAPVWVSTGLIVASSLTFEIFRRHLNNNLQPKAKAWLMVTAALGAIFISSQLFAWVQLVKMGVYVQSNQYAGFFYILTAVHAIHVIGGITGLLYLLNLVWIETDSEVQLAKRKATANTIGWYWHFMGVLWLILFVLLGFWK